MTTENQEKLTRVKVDSVLSVVSSKPTEAGKIHMFSLLDQAMGDHTIHLVFYYRSNPFEVDPVSWDLNNLRDSLSRTLDEYPVATGRLSRGPHGGWQVKCNDAGVRMLRASVDVTMDEWLRSADVYEERDLTVWEDMPQDPMFWSPFRIQINNFKCGGLAIGLSCTHMHADITSATLLIKSWAQAHQAQPLTHPPIFYLPQIQLPTSITTTKTTPSHENIIHSWSTFKFPAFAIQRALSQLQDLCPNATPFDIVVALLWSRIESARSQELTDRSLKRSIRICVDSRAHKGAPHGYFGNAFCFSELNVGKEELLESGVLGKVCDRVHRHVEGLKKGGGFLDWLGERGKGVGEQGGLRMYGPGIACIDIGSTEAASMYGAEFDKGERPAHVSCRVGNVEGEGLIIVMPSDEGGLGRTVAITLPQETIDRLCEDRIVQDMEPAMIINGRRL